MYMDKINDKNWNGRLLIVFCINIVWVKGKAQFSFEGERNY